MKIRAIELTNVRRFAGRSARIEDIADGITVLSEPNEFGKSTFFDALHALFFERHRGTRHSVKALQPHAGGAPEVAVEIDLPEGRFRIEKRWLSRPTARVLDAGGRILALDDEAEAWIERLLGGGLAGPSGLLWVRQGLLGLEPDGTSTSERSERERGLNTRRDLLSSVAGEIEMMTGGRRLDAVLARVGQDLARLATATLKPKAGGEWAKVSEEIASLRGVEEQLAAKAALLSGDLRRRTEVLRELRLLDDPTTERDRADRLAQAQATAQAAEAHGRRLAEAQQARRLAELTLQGSASEIARLEQFSERLVTAEAELHRANLAAAQAEARAEELALADQQATQALDLARSKAASMRVALRAAQHFRLAQAARDRAQDLQRTLARAEVLRRDLDKDQAKLLLTSVKPEHLARAEAAREAFDLAKAQLEAQSVSISVSYSGQARISSDGKELAEGVFSLTAPRGFDLAGIGHMRIDPGSGATDGLAQRLRNTETDLTRALADCGVASLMDARTKQAEALRLAAGIAANTALLDEVAPQGLDALRKALALAQTEADPEVSTDAPQDDPATLEAALTAAEQAEAEAHARSVETHGRAVAAGEARAAARSARQAGERTAETARLDAGALSELAARLKALQGEQIGQNARLAEAATLCAELERSAPDLATVEAELSRAQSVVAQAQSSRAKLRDEHATLNGSIGALAEQGIEEQLDEIRGRLEAALGREARYAVEVQALTRLRDTLEAARREARDAYFAPVLHELEPLLALIHPGAALQIDDQNLLPAVLTRDGQAEGLDILSGGTREQIAILTRLAFARLFAKAGKNVPVILDDALVHSDDDRIEAMFTALHRVARDQQIIVLTCRQRAFASLGGERMTAAVRPV